MISKALTFRTVVLVTLILVQLLAVILQIVGLVECKQCLLFARIYEIERVLDGGFIGWCYMLIAYGLSSVFACIVMLLRRPLLGVSFESLSRSEKSKAMFCMSATAVITTFFVILGWHQFCSSFKVVRCYHTPSLLIDWKSYTPKYSSCYNTYYYYLITEVCLLWSSISTIFLLLKTVWI
ncbi:uncharacterized protein LOC114522269 [Dendronephthya gigantea]|uniref:uncharacterized protein LOC114522269 n=1 Tax=Dendronephthya gigantea TaxID=151771 RepID=UPI00106ABABC|nr:uncharacterized protein LOC114522269 [Dendronephthya gigantea]